MPGFDGAQASSIVGPFTVHCPDSHLILTHCLMGWQEVGRIVGVGLSWPPHMTDAVVVSYFLYRNKQTSAKTWWAFEVIMPSSLFLRV